MYTEEELKGFLQGGMTTMPTDQKKKCFVIGPIGDLNSEQRINADWLLHYIIEPALKDFAPGYDVTRADKIANPGLITAQVINSVLEADLIIADLTGPNANAFYELALAHMAERKVVQMITDGQKIPFDLQEVRTVPYSRVTVEDVKKAVVALETHVRAAEHDGDHVSNPVTTARGTRELMLKGTADSGAKILKHLMASNRVLASNVSRLTNEVGDLSARLSGVEYRAIAPGTGVIYPLGSVAAVIADLARRPVEGNKFITGGLLGIRDDERPPADSQSAQQVESEPDKTDG